MKLSHILSALFGVLGAVLMAAAVVLCLFFRTAEPKMPEPSPEAEACSLQLMEALSRGDFPSAGGLIYGQPVLAAETPESEDAALIWEAFLGSISYRFDSGLYAEGTSLYRDVTLTTLDIPSLTASIAPLAQERLTQRVEAAEDPAALYDENRELLPQVLSAVLREAVSEAIAQGETASIQGRLQLFQQEGRWWAIPDRSLLKAVSGGLR